MKFNKLAEVFEKIEQESSRTLITKILAEILKEATPTESAIIAYLSLGSLNAVYVSTQFNFAEKSMVKVLAQLTSSTQHEIKDESDKKGDLGLVVAGHKWQVCSGDDLSISEMHGKLNRFLSITGTGSQEVKEQFLKEILQQLDPIAAKYVVRIILGKLRLGFSDMTLLDAFSWMECGDKSIRQALEDAYNISADIGLIVKTLKEDGLEGIQKMAIIPGIPIRPAAAERLADAKAIIKKLGPCVAQPKLDGFRLQVHINRAESTPLIRFFSRNLQDMSEMFPDLKAAVLDLKVDSLVAEGEAIAFDGQTGSFLPFQETVKRKRKHDVARVAEEYPLKLYFFDLLYADGESLLSETHEYRRKKLVELLDHEAIKKHDIIYPIEEEKVSTAQDLEHYFEQNISLGLEGLVVKRADAIYQPGKRNFNWIKLKRQESGHIDDTLDCVILGYYFGHGKRAQFGIGALLVGVYNKELDCFQTVAKIGTGLSDEEWREQKKTCDAIKIDKRPHNVECAKELYPDVWVAPEIICMVRADEITKSPLHKAGAKENELGLALRFPRLMGYRPDKSALEATTVEEVEALFKLQFKKKK